MAADMPSTVPARPSVPRVLQARDFRLSGAAIVEHGNEPALLFGQPGAEAQAVIHLPAGHYRLVTCLKAADRDHDSIWLSVGERQWTQWPVEVGKVSPAAEPCRFSLPADANVAITLKTKETGAVVHRVEVRPQVHLHRSFEHRGPEAVKDKYLLYLPPAYAKGKETWPLIVSLHGGGDRGDDLNAVNAHLPPPGREDDFPVIVACPQCPEGEGNR